MWKKHIPVFTTTKQVLPCEIGLSTCPSYFGDGVKSSHPDGLLSKVLLMAEKANTRPIPAPLLLPLFQCLILENRLRLVLLPFNLKTKKQYPRASISSNTKHIRFDDYFIHEKTEEKGLKILPFNWQLCLCKTFPTLPFAKSF